MTMCQSNWQDDSMTMCLSNSQDISMAMCDIMCPSNSQDEHRMTIFNRTVVRRVCDSASRVNHNPSKADECPPNVCKMKVFKLYPSQTSRRQLIPLFDKPSFSRFSQKCEPRFVVEIIGKIVKRQVCQKRGWVAEDCPKRRFWKDWQKMKSGFSKHFSSAWVLDLGYE
jgi:hypothetical protein